jgi:RHS repeat-associated protein
VGNRLSVSGAAGAGTYSSNALNQYTSAGGLGTLTYDANGNLASGGGWTYSHNSNSRLISANGPGGASASFGRDARNREVKRTLNGVTTYHIYDDWNLVAEYNSTGTLTTRYIHGPRVDEVLAKVTSSGSTYPLEDGLGSTIAVTSPTGAVLERISYTDAYGTPTFQTATGTPLPGTTTGTRFLFTGREWLAPLGLYDYRNRTYSPTLGRFLQTDPIRFDAGDVNLYRYVANDPANAVDPLGLQDCPCGTHWGLNLDCYSNCIESYRNPLGNMISDAMGGAAAHLGNAAGNLLAGPTGRTGVGGAKSHATSWQHKLGSKFGPLGSKVGRFAGRVTIAGTIFDGFFDLGLLAGCAISCMECIPD